MKLRILLGILFISLASAVLTQSAGAQVLYTFESGNHRDFFGRALSGIGDVNNDTVPDFIIGASGDDDNGNDSGTVWLQSGADGSVIHMILGRSPGDLFGGSVSAVSDLNQDGVDDFHRGRQRRQCEWTLFGLGLCVFRC